jgi:hypothetical protein
MLNRKPDGACSISTFCFAKRLSHPFAYGSGGDGARGSLPRAKTRGGHPPHAAPENSDARCHVVPINQVVIVRIEMKPECREILPLDPIAPKAHPHHAAP